MTSTENKEKKQKQYFLSNISEIYSQFEKKKLDRKVGFSTFALLRPKWCIPVGAAATQNVYVYIYHQNVKLMLVAMNSSSKFRQMMKSFVYDVDKYDCIMRNCDNCPDLSVLKPFLSYWKYSIQMRQFSSAIGSTLIGARLLKKRVWWFYGGLGGKIWKSKETLLRCKEAG